MQGLADKMSTYRVMIVDDSSLVREVLTTLVKQDPHLEVCAEAENGREAIVKCAEHDPDLILLDLQMPEFDGLNFLRHYRKQTRAKIIILSAMVSGHRKPIGINALKMGADAVVCKPENMSDEQSDSIQELMRTVYELLDLKAS
jgi:chemotaxis response regulator CheB